MQSEKEEFWTLPPFVALNERGQVSKRRKCVQLSLIGNKEVAARYEEQFNPTLGGLSV